MPDNDKGFTRRDLARSAAAGGAFFAMGAMGAGQGRAEEAADKEPAMETTMLDVRAFGAKGDGKADDTAAVQKAFDAAAEKGGAVFVSPGTYLCSTVRTHHNLGIVGIPAWDYHKGGGSCLKLADEKASCLIDLTEGQGVTIDGLSLDGGRLGEGVHGIFMNKPEEKRRTPSASSARASAASPATASGSCTCGASPSASRPSRPTGATASSSTAGTAS